MARMAMTELLVHAAHALASGCDVLAKYSTKRRPDMDARLAYAAQLDALRMIAESLEASAQAEIRAGVTIN